MPAFTVRVKSALSIQGYAVDFLVDGKIEEFRSYFQDEAEQIMLLRITEWIRFGKLSGAEASALPVSQAERSWC